MSELYVLTRDERVEVAVATALGIPNHLPPAMCCRNELILAARLQRDPAPLVLVDIDPNPLRAIEEVEPLVAQFSESRFIALCDRPESAVVLRAMQAGIRHLQPKAGMASDLPGVLERLQNRNRLTVAKRGLVISVFQASGGCGATTTSVNLANELSILINEPVLLVDMDYCYGAAASYLGLSGLYGIAEVLNHHSEIDNNLLTTTAVKPMQNLHVLMSPASIDFARSSPLPTERIGQLFHTARQTYPFTVLDAPKLPLGSMINLAEEGDTVLVVFQQLVKDVQIVRSILGALEAHGFPPERIFPVMNRYSRRGRMVSLSDAQKAIRLPIHLLRNDFSSAALGINYGKPLSEIARRSALRKDLSALAEHLVKIHKANDYGNQVR